jgi:hypothetical protein
VSPAAPGHLQGAHPADTAVPDNVQYSAGPPTPGKFIQRHQFLFVIFTVGVEAFTILLQQQLAVRSNLITSIGYSKQ